MDSQMPSETAVIPHSLPPVQAFRIPHNQEAAALKDAEASSNAGGDLNPTDFYWAVASARPLEETPEFASLVQPVPAMMPPVVNPSAGDMMARGVHGGEPHAQMMKHQMMWAPPGPMGYSPRAMPPRTMMPPPFGMMPPLSFVPNRPPTPPWVTELMSFTKARNPPLEETIPRSFGSEERMNEIRNSCDMLAVTLLRMINSIQCVGDIESKIMLSRQSPPNELKEMWNTAFMLAEETFEAFPPYLACISKNDLIQVNGLPPIRTDNSGLDTALSSSAPALLPPLDSLPSSMSLPQSIVQFPPSLHSSSGVIGAMSAPCPSSTTLNALPYSAGMLAANGSFISKDYFDLGGGAGGTHQFLSTSPPHSFYHGASLFAPPSSFSAFSSNFTRGPPLERRRLSAPDLGGLGDSAAYPSPSTQLIKKNLSIGDRPLTPPAHGWHAKYSSGVTGVVWDRVHQAWVVSWTLAGKRTFRHFTCKSYGGFEKARDAAIEFRLARNRDIAAYNRRCKDRRS